MVIRVLCLEASFGPGVGSGVRPGRAWCLGGVQACQGANV